MPFMQPTIVHSGALLSASALSAKNGFDGYASWWRHSRWPLRALLPRC